MQGQEEETTMEMRYDHLYKCKYIENNIEFIVILVGDMGVGKSSLLSKYVKGIFPTSPLPTIAIEFATKIIQLKEGGYVKAMIWDTAGQEKYKSITSYHYRKAVGALLVYDVTKKFTFTDIQRWLTELRQYAEPDCIVMLVGNKFDLIERNNRKREVTYEEAKAFAEENKLLFYETSALSSYKVNDCFEDLLQDIYNERRKVTNVQKQMYSNVVKLAEKNKIKEESKCC